MITLLRQLKSWQVALIAATLLSLILATNPLVGLHGLEAGLILSIVLGPFAAFGGARAAIFARSSGTPIPLNELYRQCFALALMMWVIPAIILALNALRVTQCAPGIGLVYMLLGPGMSLGICVLGGALVALALPFDRLSSVLAPLIPLAGIAHGLYRLWSSPAIYSYVHAVGYAPGTIYDEGLHIPEAYFSFRALTIMLMTGLVLLGHALIDADSLRTRLRGALEQSGSFTVGLALIGGVVIADVYGAELGHRSSTEMTSEILGAEHSSARCTIIYPREMSPGEARQIGEECDFQVGRLEAYLGVQEPAEVRVFLFRDANEKQRLMGAGRTYIAKPWRREVYLQRQAWPHPILAHELAHIVARNAASGPLEIAATWGGWLPNPGLIEGVAVAAAWDIRADLTPHQWSRAMLDLDALPAVEQLMDLSFGLLPSRRAYSASGSFVRWLMDTHGQEAIQQAYASGSVAEAAGEPIQDLEAAWRAWLTENVEVSEAELERVRLAMLRRSVFSAVCPHRMADLHQQLMGDLAAHDDARTRDTCHQALEIDPTDIQARTQLVGAYARSGESTLAEHEFTVLRDEFEAPAPALLLASEALADAAWRHGDHHAAEESYAELLSGNVTDAQGRRLEVKLIGIQSEPGPRDAIFNLLVGEELGPATPAVAVSLAADLNEMRVDGLGAYLGARQLFAAQRFGLARVRLERAQARGLSTERLRREAARLYAISLFALGRWDDAEAGFRNLMAMPGVRPALTHQAELWLARVEHAR